VRHERVAARGLAFALQKLLWMEAIILRPSFARMNSTKPSLGEREQRSAIATTL